MQRFSLVLLFFAALLPVQTGCENGPRMAEVTGAVKVDGVPLEKGDISFFPLTGNLPTAGGVIKDGAYKALVPLGEMKVVISAPRVVGQKKLYPNDPKSAVRDVTVEALPERYNEKSELRLDVNAATVKHDFDLKK